MDVCSICGNTNSPDARFCKWCGTIRPGTTPTGLLPPQSLLCHDRYLVVERVGKGGMGAVYKAMDLRSSHQVVAIKEMSQDGLAGQDLQDAIATFMREADLLTRLQHPGLPHIHQQFEEDGRRYLVMDFVEGQTLEQRMLALQKQGKKFTLEQVLAIARQLCDVLAYLHRQQPPIIFRDMKPANVMLNAQGQVYLIDFGIARFFKQGQTKDTVALGSPGYAPPEQYRQATSPRSDIYGLGATLHHLLTGEDPSENPFHFRQIALQNPALEHLIMRMVALDEDQRPASIDEVLAGLSAGATRSPATASKPHASSGGALTLYVLISSSVRDHTIWRDINNHVISLTNLFPRIIVEEYRPNDDADVLLNADLVLILFSPDLLHSVECTRLVNVALDAYEAHEANIFPVLLSASPLDQRMLARLKGMSETPITHPSLYAQEQHALECARKIRRYLALLVLKGQRSGPMNLLQWLFCLLYAGGSSSCPYFVVGEQYVLRYMRPASLDRVLLQLIDVYKNRAIAEYMLNPQITADLSSLLPLISPASRNLADIQGVAVRDRP